jgi:hypothetical protein
VGRVPVRRTFSIARMDAPPGWDEPFQTPEFDEVTIVLSGTMRVEHDSSHIDVGGGEMVLVARASAFDTVIQPRIGAHIMQCVYRLSRWKPSIVRNQ